MKTRDEESNLPVNKKLMHIVLSSFAVNDGEDHIQWVLTISLASSVPRALIIFAHGSGSDRDSPRNRQVVQDLNENGFATDIVCDFCDGPVYGNLKF